MMPDAGKAPGQHVHGKAPDKLTVREAQHVKLITMTVIFCSKSNLSIVDAFEPVIADGNFVGVPSQVLHHLKKKKKWSLAIHHPVFGKKRFG